jgi:2-polyprenyl-3-methyl-5-hydroxy-6-metoxy-1,4-benzoquinol methylase
MNSTETPRILAVIANYGYHNQQFLMESLASLKSMPFDVTIEILSDQPKDFGSDIAVRVGVPGRSSWSLPFAYKKTFVERSKDFDLYIYSEDDILITARHVRAFLEVTALLSDDMIAGFTRYERDDAGDTYFIDMFRAFHFLPGSTCRHGGETFGELSNEHSGCFMLTKRHLARALQCPGFFQGPRHGYYGIAETAATEPYTQCGMKKVLCLSRFADFVVHHLPNKYCKRATHSLATKAVVDSQCATLETSPAGIAVELVNPRLKIESMLWDKAYYSPVDLQSTSFIRPDGLDVLSIGCGVGATELFLFERGHAVTVIPLDGVIAAYARQRGIRVLTPNFNAAFSEIAEDRFDSILLLDVLQYVPDPIELLVRCGAHLKDGGVLIVRTPNFVHTNLVHQLVKSNVRVRDLTKLTNFKASGIHRTSRGTVTRWLTAAGFECGSFMPIAGERLRSHPSRRSWMKLLPAFITTRECVFVATRMLA